MRHLILMRHGEAGFSGVGQSDFDRPLTDRGLQNIVSQARTLQDHKLLPDKVICSPALRTRTTWDVLHGQLKSHLSIDFQLDTPQSLYNAAVSHVYDTIRGVSDNIDILYLIGHNPGIHEMVIRLSDPVPGKQHSPLAIKAQGTFAPGTMAIFDFNGRRWFEASNTNMTLRHVISPRD